MSAILPDQPPPVDGVGDVWADLIAEAESDGRCSPTLLAAMRERRELGIQRYGKPLQYENGRDPLVDAAQELLDAAVYLRQAGGTVFPALLLGVADAVLSSVRRG